MSADPPYLTVGTEVSAKYKGAFCEAKIKKCQKTVKCKVSPRDGGPQISVTDDSVQGELKISAHVKVRQPDSGQIIDGVIVRIVDSSVYTVVFDDGDVATLKRTQICLKGDKHFMESETLDKLPLTNPEHFGTPVNLLKKERRRKTGLHSSPSGTVSDDSDVDDDHPGSSRRISPRSSKSNIDFIGKVVSMESGDKKKATPALVIRPANHEADMKHKGLLMVKSFRDNRISTVSEKNVKEFTKDSAKSFPDDKFTRAAVEKALTYLSTKELPASWKREDLFGIQEPPKPIEQHEKRSESESDSEDEEEELCDRFLAQLYKYMDERSTPINKPAQLYNKDVNLYKLFKMVTKLGGYHKVSAADKKWKEVASSQGFNGMSAGTETKLLYRRYLLPYEEFHKKMGNWQLFEGAKSPRRLKEGGRNVLPPKERELQHAMANDKSMSKISSEKKITVPDEPPPKKTPVRQSLRKEDKSKIVDSKPPESPGSRASRARSSAAKPNIKTEKAVKIDFDKEEEKPSGNKGKKSIEKPVEEVSDTKMDSESAVSEDENSIAMMEVDFPPGTKLKVRYGRQRNMKIYDAKVMEVRLGEDKILHYSVHYSGWNVRYDEVITSDRIVGPVGKCEKKKMEVFREGFGPGKIKRPRGTNPVPPTSASSTGSRTPEPPATKTTSKQTSSKSTTPVAASKSSTNSTSPTPAPISGRATRSSINDTNVTITRPTRSRSIDSTLSSGLPARKKPKREQKSVEPTEQDNEDSTEEGSSVAENDVEKPDETQAASEDISGIVTTIKTDDDIINPEEMIANNERPTTPASQQANEDTEEKTPKRLSRKSAKAMMAAQPSSPSTSVNSDQSTSRRTTRRTESPVCQTKMTSEIKTRMCDVIDKVAEGEIAVEDKSPPTESERLSPPPTKRKKPDRQDSNGSASTAGAGQAVVKIEPMKHKKPSITNEDTASIKQKEPDGETEESLELPPLLPSKQTDAKSGNSSPANDTNKTESEKSFCSDNSTEKNSNQPDEPQTVVCKSVTSTTTSGTTTSGTITSGTITSGTTTTGTKAPSEETSTVKPEPPSNVTSHPKPRQRPPSTRRQARRSPKHRPAALEDENSLNQEVSHIIASSSSILDSISPTKMAKQQATRPPRQPKYNFRVEEELSEIADQEARITFLTDKLAEIRSLYADVKSNLASIERKRRRVKRKDTTGHAISGGGSSEQKAT